MNGAMATDSHALDFRPADQDVSSHVSFGGYSGEVERFPSDCRRRSGSIGGIFGSVSRVLGGLNRSREVNSLLISNDAQRGGFLIQPTRFTRQGNSSDNESASENERTDGGKGVNRLSIRSRPITDDPQGGEIIVFGTLFLLIYAGVCVFIAVGPIEKNKPKSDGADQAEKG
jgi:hypothetical protein